MEYLLLFCRAVVGLIFVWSFIGKLRYPNAFLRSIQNFKLLPQPLIKPSAGLFMAAELMTVIAMIIGRDLLVWGFMLGALLLLVFSSALASVLVRKIKTSCNCFGASEKLVSPFDLVRNFSFLSCGLAGSILQISTSSNFASIDWLSKILTTFIAFVFVLIFTQLEDIVSILK